MLAALIFERFDLLSGIGGRLWPSLGGRFEHYLLFASIFLPDAIRQLNWRKSLLLSSIALGTWMAAAGEWDKLVPIPWPMAYLSWPAITVGVCHWAANPPRRASFLIWLVALTVAVACVLPAIEIPVRCMSWIVWLPMPGRRRWDIDPAYQLYWLLLAMVTWLAIPLASRLAAARGGAARWAALVGISGCIAWFIAYFAVIQYRLAARSLVTGKPFDRSYAAAILQGKDGSQVDQLLWNTVESADWSTPIEGAPFWDYRRDCIEGLFRRNPAATAKHLAAMLRQKPSSPLAAYSAAILAKEHRYEAAPELMRYSLMFNGREATSALESMRIPQAAIGILQEESVWVIITSRGPWPIQIDAKFQRRLADLLGKDVGTKRADWQKFYAEAVGNLPTPLSRDQAREVDRVVAAMNSYWLIRGQRRSQSAPPPNLDISGTGALEREIQKYKAAASTHPATTARSS